MGAAGQIVGFHSFDSQVDLLEKLGISVGVVDTKQCLYLDEYGTQRFLRAGCFVVEGVAWVMEEVVLSKPSPGGDLDIDTTVGPIVYRSESPVDHQPAHINYE